MKARRWFCHACAREWLPNGSAMGAQPWSDADGCPTCHSAQIQAVEYEAEFPGGDIPRSGSVVPFAAPVRVPDYVTAPPAVLMAEQPHIDFWQVI